MILELNGTKVTIVDKTLGYQGDNLVDTIQVTVDKDSTWNYKLDMYKGKSKCFDSVLMTREGNICTVQLTNEILSYGGRYIFQLRGYTDTQTYHSDIFESWVNASIEYQDDCKQTDCGCDCKLPTEFYQVEDNVTEINNHPPYPGDNNKWMIWDVDRHEYVESDIDVISGGEEYQTKANLTTSVTAQSTDIQYPSAKAVYDAIEKAKPDIVTPTAESTDTQAASAKAVWDMLGGGSSLTTAQINALDGMFKVAAYDDNKDVSGAYAAFKAAFGLVDSGDTGGGGEETPDATTYTISAELVNVTSSNNATSATEGASYTATLTATDGYKLDTVSIIMGGVDVTADVYADGVISIASVTGNVEIVASASAETVGAVLPEDGLLAFWDLRNAASTTDWVPTIGDAAIYKLQSVNTWDAQTVDSHGVLLQNGTYGGAKIQKADESGTFADMEHGTAFTIVTMGYSPEDGAMIGTHAGRDGFGKWYLHAKYTNTEGTMATAKSVQTEVSAVGGTYCPEIYRVDGTQMSLHLYGTEWLNEDGSSYDGFDHWEDGVFIIRSIKNHPSAYLTAVAIYNRALTDVEIVEIGEYLKTLEVTA